MNESTIKFYDFLSEFQKTFLWGQMVATYENSPWHREENVGVHTMMLLNWYKENLLDKRDEKQNMQTLIASLFHDVGKPKAEIVKFSEARGTYRAYHGHELLSARIWTDYALTNRDQINKLKLSLTDIANIALMIEHHVPFAIKDKKKRAALKGAFFNRMGKDGHRAWLDLLLSDQHGRISDDQETKLADVATWLKEWEQV